MLERDSTKKMCEEEDVSYDDLCFRIKNNREMIHTVTVNLNKFDVPVNYNRLIRSTISDLKNQLKLLEPPLPSDYIEECDKPPELLYKYVRWKHAAPNLKNKVFSCGTADQYREDDEDELNTERTAEINPGPEERIFSEMMVNILTPEIGDFDTVVDKLNAKLNDNFLIGCFSDKPNDEMLWRIRACNYGVCIAVKPSPGYYFYKILYQEYLCDYGYLKNSFQELTSSMMLEIVPKIKSKYDQLLKQWITLSFMSIFRKNRCWEFESEWRVVINGIRGNKDPVHLHRLPEVVSVEGRLNEEDAASMKEACDYIHVPFHNTLTQRPLYFDL